MLKESKEDPQKPHFQFSLKGAFSPGGLDEAYLFFYRGHQIEDLNTHFY